MIFTNSFIGDRSFPLRKWESNDTEQWQEVDVMKKHSSDRPKYKRGNVADIALASVPNTSVRE